MSCIYIALFLVTMLIISQQVSQHGFCHVPYRARPHPRTLTAVSASQNENCFRQDFLLKYKNRTEQDEIETRENLNRLLLENVLPAHVATLFVGENKKNEVMFPQTEPSGC